MQDKSSNMHYLLLVLLLFITGGLFSQTIINLPDDDGGGSLIGDILIANDKIFAYSADGISIYKVADNSFEKKILFTNAMGKFNPVYHDARLHVPDQSIMVYNGNDDSKYVYALTPKLELLIIDTDDLNQTWTIQLQVADIGDPEPYLDDQLDSQSGRVILKYDNNNGHERLYILVGARDKVSNSTGGFHEQRAIFAIYEVDYNVSGNNPPIFNLHYSEINKAIPGSYPMQINNFVFNETDDNFYIVRMGKNTSYPPYEKSEAIIEVREVTLDGVSDPKNTFLFENIDGPHYHKMGKMLYIHDTDPYRDIHKVVIFPYRYFQGNTPSPRFCVINIYGTNSHSASYVDLPSKRILDAVYLEDNQDIVVSYAPDEEQIIEGYENTNAAVYHYDASTGFVLTQHFVNDNSTITSDLDINSSFFLTKLDGGTTLISKKDGVDKLEWDDNLEPAPGYVYSDQEVLNAEGNFFMEGIVEGAKTYINNTVSNGIEVCNNSTGAFEIENRIRTGYPVYHIVANSDGSRHIYFNKLESYNTGLYCYSYIPAIGQDPPSELIENINSDSHTDNNIETAIGDVVYNPFKDHFLISKFEKGNADILILDAFDYDKTGQIEIDNVLPGTQFATEMFISPNGRLYIWTNMNNDDVENPTIFIYDANDYSYIDKVIVDEEFIYNKIYTNYTAQFCYNHYDETVNTTITVQEHKYMPYNTEASSIYYTYYEAPPGKLLVLNDVLAGNPIPLAFYPGKVIFPGTCDNYESSQYYGKLFIIGKKFHMYNYINPGQPAEYDHNFIDITYSAIHDKLFAVKEYIVDGEEKEAEIWSIDINQYYPVFELYSTGDLNKISGQIASIFSNPYDGRIYVYQKVDRAKLGDIDVSLYSFDPADENPTWDITTLGFATYFPDYDHTRNLSYYFFNNRTTPYINPYTNHIYLPNGGHSSISKVEFTAVDQLTLEPGTNWISIPRHEGNTGHFKGVPAQGVPYDYDYHPTSDVFHKDNFVPDYIRLQLAHNAAEGAQEVLVYANYNNPGFGWNFQDDMGSTYSYRGYKLNTYLGEASTLTLEGKVENPNALIELKQDKENWVGYFLHEKQDIFDALADFKDQLYIIKHKDYFCYYGDANDFGGPPSPGQAYWWICDTWHHNIDYGEMVVLVPYEDVNDPMFQWNFSGNPPGAGTDEETEHYSYEETPDYSAFIIELDSTENPVEMGAFVNDSCIGACTLTPEDTLVIIRGYLGIQPGDSVVFEEYFGTKSTNKNRINDYYVLNQQTKIHERRTIKTGENKPMYFVSFKPVVGQKPIETERSFDIFPNPVNNTLNITYNLPVPAIVNISIYDSYGRYIITLLNSGQTYGSHSLQWNLNGNNGMKVNKGLYIIKLKIDEVIMSRKVVVN